MDSDASWDDGLFRCEARPGMGGWCLCWMTCSFSAEEVEGLEDELTFSGLAAGCGVSTTKTIGRLSWLAFTTAASTLRISSGSFLLNFRPCTCMTSV